MSEIAAHSKQQLRKQTRPSSGDLKPVPMHTAAACRCLCLAATRASINRFVWQTPCREDKAGKLQPPPAGSLRARPRCRQSSLIHQQLACWVYMWRWAFWNSPLWLSSELVAQLDDTHLHQCPIQWMDRIFLYFPSLLSFWFNIP
jgi:hypothetical protein